MMRFLAGLAVGVAVSASVCAEESPLVGVLAPDAGGTAFHTVPGWHPTGQRLRVLDEAAKPICCLRLNPDPMPRASDLRTDDTGRGTRHAVTAEGKLVRRLAEGPLLAPALASGVRVGRTGSERSSVTKSGRQWTLERCLTQEGLRLTVSFTRQDDKAAFHFPLGYDVESTCP